MQILILIDGSRRRPPVVFQGSYGLAKGVHVFVRSRGKWLRRDTYRNHKALRVMFHPVADTALIRRLDDLWNNAKKKTPRSDDVDFLGLMLTIDASNCAVRRRKHAHDGVFEKRDSDARDENLRELEEAFDQLESALDGDEATLDFTKYLLGHAHEIHHALHLIALGDPTGVTSLLLIVFAALGRTFADQHDLESIGLDLIERAGPRTIRLSSEAWETVRTSYEIGSLVQEDRELWLKLDIPVPSLDPPRRIEREAPSLDISDDFGLSL